MNNVSYNCFLKDAEEKLLNGDSVICFRKYQLDVLSETYKDNLIYHYNENTQWWSCRLNDLSIKYPSIKEIDEIKKSRTIKELYNQGHTLKSIKDRFGISVYKVKKILDLK